MRFFHRTSLSPDDVLAEADRYFSDKGTTSEIGSRNRTFTGPAGRISLSVRPEGGHYTRVSVETDHSCQGEAERVAKGFFTTVHLKVHRAHVARGTH